MNENLGSLLECPRCKALGKKQYLGKILENGQFMVLRFHHGTTIIEAKQYSIACGCGYQFNVSNGTVVLNQSQI